MPARTRNLIVTASIVVWMLAAWGFAGSMDLDDEIRTARIECDRTGGRWIETQREHNCYTTGRRVARNTSEWSPE